NALPNSFSSVDTIPRAMITGSGPMALWSSTLRADGPVARIDNAAIAQTIAPRAVSPDTARVLAHHRRGRGTPAGLPELRHLHHGDVAAIPPGGVPADRRQRPGKPRTHVLAPALRKAEEETWLRGEAVEPGRGGRVERRQRLEREPHPAVVRDVFSQRQPAA